MNRSIPTAGVVGLESSLVFVIDRALYLCDANTVCYCVPAEPAAHRRTLRDEGTEEKLFFVAVMLER